MNGDMLSNQDLLPATASRGSVGSLLPSERLHDLGGMGRLAGAAAGAADGVALNPYKLVHRALRGRYVLTATLALLLAAAGGLVGLQLGARSYRSEGLVRIANTLPAVFGETDQNRPITNYDAVMQTQQMVLTGRRVLDRALQDPAWKETGKGASPEIIRWFSMNLKVSRPSKSDTLLVTFSDSDPTVAAAAVRSIVNAYAAIYIEETEAPERQRLQTLREKHAGLAKQHDELQAQIRAMGEEFGTTNLEALCQSAEARVTRLDATLTDVRLALAQAESQRPSRQGASAPDAGGAPAAAPEASGPDAAIAALTTDQIGMLDGTMRQYLSDREAQQAELARLRLSLGANHRDVVGLTRSIQVASDRITKYAEEYRQFRALTAGRNGAAVPGVAPAAAPAPAAGAPNSGAAVLLLAGKSAEQLAKDEANVAAFYERARKEMVALGAKRMEIERLKSKAAGVNDELASTSKRLALIEGESTIGGRLTVISRGEVPISPAKSTRIPFAAGGAFAGAVLPVALFLAFGLTSRRYRYSDETDMAANAPLLGILPTLPDRLAASAEEAASAAAQSVHHMRVMLQVNGRSGERPAYLITSSTPGEGKTSLTLALAFSYAASGARTLVIDCDLVGQRLSRGFGAGEVPGIHEALKTGGFREFVKKTATPGLYLLPAGNAEATDACTLSAAAVKKLIAEVRRYFDVVLIDSGPILGSIEAAVVAPEVDGVVMTITRGQQGPLVDRAIRHLNEIGARLSGVVFNRATAKDFYRSAYASSSFRSLPGTAPRNRLADLEADGESQSRFGPLVQSVVTFMPEISAR